MLIEDVRLAFMNMAANKLRTFLTMLGIIIGIAAVIAIMTVGSAQTAENERQNSMYGVNTVSVNMWLKDGVEITEDTNTADLIPEFKESMLDKMVQNYADEIEAIAVQTYLPTGGPARPENSTNDRIYANCDVTGVNPGYFTVNKGMVPMKAGRVFSRKETGEDSYVCIVSDLLVKNLFDGDADKALGSRIDIPIASDEDSLDYTYTIIGVYGFSDMAGYAGVSSEKDISTTVYIPFKNAQALSTDPSAKKISNFDLTVTPGVDVIQFSNDLNSYLTSLLPADTNDQIYVYNNQEWIEQSNENMRKQTLTITMIGAIALVVGGIGVMNIMTVTITERTREIGTRKALGAKRREIRLQFITEAVIMSLLGGVIGIAAGIGAGIIVCHFVQHIPPVVSIPSVAASFLVSVGIGIFFGFYPADKAAKMDPIEALRYE
jgi:putative ABC transport system permease protein